MSKKQIYKKRTLEDSMAMVNLVFAELKKAEIKHPGWPKDYIHAAGIILEEAGEAMKEAIDITYKRKTVDDFKKELAQTAAMAIRALLNLPSKNI